MKNTTLFILILIAGTACKKNNEIRPVLVSTFSKEALKYAQLPLHRYFIYKDSATAFTDSVVVTKSDLYMDPNPVVAPNGSGYGNGVYYKGLDSEQVYKLIVSIPAGQVKWFDGEARAGSAYAIDSAALAFCGRDNLLPLTVDRNSNCLYGFAYLYVGVSTSLASLAIEGKTYNEVLQVVSTNGMEQDANEPWYFKSTYYWTKGVGIIKRTVVTSVATTTCTLIKYGQN